MQRFDAASEFLRGHEEWYGVSRSDSGSLDFFRNPLLGLTDAHLRIVEDTMQGKLPPTYLPIQTFYSKIMSRILRLSAQGMSLKVERSPGIKIGNSRVEADIFSLDGVEFVVRPIEGAYQDLFFAAYSEGSPTTVLRALPLLTRAESIHREERAVATSDLVAPPGYNPDFMQGIVHAQI